MALQADQFGRFCCFPRDFARASTPSTHGADVVEISAWPICRNGGVPPRLFCGRSDGTPMRDPDDWIDLVGRVVDDYGVTRPRFDFGRARFPLHGCTATVCRVGSECDCWQVELFDIGGIGVGMASPVLLEIGQQVRLRFNASFQQRRTWDLIIVWTREGADGSFLVGARHSTAHESQRTAD